MKDIKEFFVTYTWWGKILGAIFGFLLAGAPGAFVGILVGNFFDRGLASHFSRPHWEYVTERRHAVQKIFFQATFTIMGHIAKADGRVSENEIKMAEVLMREMRLNLEEKKRAQQYFTEGKSPNFNLSSKLNELQDAFHLNPELLRLFVDIQYRAAKIDGLSEKKIESLNIILRRFGFSPLHKQDQFYQDFHYNRAQSSTHRNYSNKQSYNHNRHSSLSEAYAILGVSKQAGKVQVKKAYRRLVSRHHPDKLIAKGLPESMIKIATEKTQKLRQAYEMICTSKGWHH